MASFEFVWKIKSGVSRAKRCFARCCCSKPEITTQSLNLIKWPSSQMSSTFCPLPVFITKSKLSCDSIVLHRLHTLKASTLTKAGLIWLISLKVTDWLTDWQSCDVYQVAQCVFVSWGEDLALHLLTELLLTCWMWMHANPQLTKIIICCIIMKGN